MRFDKPIGTFLVLWPALWALWIAAQGVPNLGVLVVFILGAILMRAAGCVINDYADRHFDPQVSRTQNRPLASGQITPKSALILFAALGSIAFLLVLLLNKFTLLLALVAMSLAILYPFMKRYTYWPQLFLGLAFSMAIPMAFSAQLDRLPWICWPLFAANLCWTLAYDTQYALMDYKDDLGAKIKSTAVRFGEKTPCFILCMQISSLVLWLWVGNQLALGIYFYGGLGVAAALLLCQQYWIKQRTMANYLRAFTNNQWVGCAIFIGIALSYLH